MASLRKYLKQSANYKEFSSSAEISKVLELAELDLKKGTSIGKLVYRCCRRFPKKEALEKLIEVAKRTESERNVVDSVFDYEDQNGYSCMITLFEMANGYRNKNNEKYPSGTMLRDIEESAEYLIDLAKKFDLNMNKILNHTAKNGLTVFFQASIFSEKITKRLIEEKVKVNSVDHKFVTPFFRVR